MTSKLTDRLARLEAHQAPTVVEISHSPGIRLLWLLLAVHAGNLQDHEAIAEGAARACGYDRAAGMRAAMLAGGTSFMEWSDRHGIAVEDLIAKHRDGPLDGRANEAVIRFLVADLPERFRSNLSTDASNEAIARAAEWVSL